MKYKFKLPLFWKFTIAITGIVIVFGTINSYLIYNNVQRSLLEEKENEGLFAAKTLAKQATPLFLFEDYVALQNLINEAKAIDTTIVYIFLLDASNNVVVSTFENNVPSQLKEINTPNKNSEDGFNFVSFKSDAGNVVLDISSPILSNKVGRIRIGISENSINQSVLQSVNIFWIMVGFFLITGITGAFIFAKFITDPIIEIQITADKIDLNEIGKSVFPVISIRQKLFGKFKMLFRAEDEIDILASRFNEMIKRLEGAYIELQKAQSYLLQSEKLAVVGTLTAGLAHEINNPIAGIQNCIRRIKESPQNLEQNKKYIKLMGDAVNKIENVVSNLLNFSRKPSTDFIPVQLIDVIETALLLVGHRLEKHRISVSKRIQNNLQNIRGNKNELEQVFVNLFINAIDAIEEQCKQTVHCEKRIVIEGEVENTNIIIIIKDTGSGIPKQNIGHIYEPFFTTKPVGQGTGLGLSIVYNIVKSHNGTITIESEDGKGTSVRLSFPFLNKQEKKRYEETKHNYN